MVPAPLMNTDGRKQENWSAQNSPGKCVLQRNRCHALKTGGATASQVLARSLTLGDMAKALVLLADSHILETCFAQVTGLRV